MDITEEEKARIREKVEKLKNSKFKQQTLPAWRPIPSFKSTMITFTVFGLIFLALGIVLYIMSEQIVEKSVQYNNSCTIGTDCKLTIEIDETIEAPIYVYYQLDNFYQNHRRYVKSRDYDQLKGEVKTVGDLSDCDPVITVAELGIASTVGGTVTLASDAPANPCGLVAKSYFNDTYTLTNSSSDTTVTISETDIAWESDIKYKFKNAENYTSIQWTDVENEHFIVWMRTAGLPNFRKLWGRIEGDLIAGTYTVTINNIYDVSAYDGSKYFVLSTTNALGGKNYFLAICYIVVGSLCIIFAIIFFIAFLRKRRGNKRE